MSTEIQPTRSFFQRIRSSIHAVEAAEFVALVLILGRLWFLIMIVYAVSENQWAGAITMAFLAPVALLLAWFILWGSYLLYIRIARWGGSIVFFTDWQCSRILSIFWGRGRFVTWNVTDVPAQEGDHEGTPLHFEKIHAP